MSQPLLKPSLLFFKSKVSDLNDKRQQLNRSKGFAKYLTQSRRAKSDLALVDTTFGIMSFSLYLLRFSSNLGLLAELILYPSAKDKSNINLYLDLLNDSLWSTVNLLQFFWLSYKKSQTAGLYGMQLETLAQLIDLLVLITRHRQEKMEYELKLSQATPAEQARLTIDWQNKELNTLRTMVTAFSIVLLFGLIFFAKAALPLSPLITAIVLINSLIKLLMNIDKDRKLLALLKQENADPQKINNEQLSLKKARLRDLNQIILNCVFFPLIFFLLITTPIPVALTAGFSMVLIYYLVDWLIENNDSINADISSAKVF